MGYKCDIQGSIPCHSGPQAGASAGSLIAACHHSGVAPGVLLDATLALAEDCRRKGTRGRLRHVLVRASCRWLLLRRCSEGHPTLETTACCPCQGIAALDRTPERGRLLCNVLQSRRHGFNMVSKPRVPDLTTCPTHTPTPITRHPLCKCEVACCGGHKLATVV